MKIFDCQLLDVTDVPAVQETVAGAFHKHGKVDAVVSNADYGLFGCADELACCQKPTRNEIFETLKECL